MLVNFLLDASVANAGVLYRCGGHPTFANCNAKPTLVSELLELVQSADAIQLPFPMVPPGSRVRPRRTSEEVRRLRLEPQHRHHPDFQILPSGSKLRGTCPLHSVRRQTAYFCNICGTFLHPAPCFGMFHSLDDLRGVTVD